MRAADLLIRCLEREGVATMFGVPGEENLDVMDALLDSSIRFITTRHEQGAAFMAAMTGRLTGEPGVCLSTLGPGATNLVTGVADANMDQSPLLAITGQGGLNRRHKESHQYYDLVSLFRPITKWNAPILIPEVIPEMTRKAFAVAAAEKPGATHLEFPEDVAAAAADGEPLTSSPAHHEEAGGRDLARALEALDRSRTPMLLVGGGVTRMNASGQLRAFAEKLQAPTVHTFMGTGALPWDHPLCLATAGLQGKDHIAAGFDQADLIVAIGFDMDEYHPFLWNPDRRLAVLHIDSVAAEIDAHYPVCASVIGDVKLNLAHLTDALAQRTGPAPYVRGIKENIVMDLETYRDDAGFPLKPQRIVAGLRSVLAKDDIVISDVGAHKMWIARMYPAYEPNTCLISNGFASMGFALPSAIAAKLVKPERNVVAAVGDGALQMSISELETAVRLRLPIVILIWRDDRYGLIEWKQRDRFGRPSHIAFGNPDFVKLARAYGADGAKIEAAAELEGALRQGLRSNVPFLIDCPVDYRENLKLSERLGGD